MKTFDNLTKYIPLGGVFIVFLSYIKQATYYYLFNIDIINYINLSEFITLFLKDSVFILLLISLTIPLFLWFKFIKIFTEFIKNRKYPLILLMILLTISIIGLIHSLKSLKNDIDNVGLNLVMAGISTSTLSMILILSAMLIIWKAKISIKIQVMMCAFFTIIITFSFAIYSAYKIKNENIVQNYSIDLKNRIIQTDNNLVRIGQTEKYFFLFNKLTKTSIILKTEDISEINIKSNLE